MKEKYKAFLLIIPVSLLGATLAISAIGPKPLSRLSSSTTNYELTLDSTNAPAELTASFQRNVSTTITTALGNEITLNFTIAKALDNGYVQLGNYGTVYCITNDDHHISGLSSVRVIFSGGALTLKSSSVNFN